MDGQERALDLNGGDRGIVGERHGPGHREYVVRTIGGVVDLDVEEGVEHGHLPVTVSVPVALAPYSPGATVGTLAK